MDGQQKSWERLRQLAESFKAALQGRAARPMPVAPVDQKTAAESLRQMASERSRLIVTEIDGLLDVSRLSQERVSLLLRYRPQIFGNDAQGAAHVITGDLDFSAQACQLAEKFRRAAESMDPAVAENHDAMIFSSLSETARLIDGIARSPLPQEEVVAFHALYETPDDALFFFNQKTAALADSMVRLADLSMARVAHTMAYVGCIDDVVKPAFPEHAAGMEAQAQQMMDEAAGSLQRSSTLLKGATSMRAGIRN